MTNPHRQAKQQLKEQIEDSLAELRVPVLGDREWASLLNIPKKPERVGLLKEDRDGREDENTRTTGD